MTWSSGFEEQNEGDQGSWAKHELTGALSWMEGGKWSWEMGQDVQTSRPERLGSAAGIYRRRAAMSVRRGGGLAGSKTAAMDKADHKRQGRFGCHAGIPAGHALHVRLWLIDPVRSRARCRRAARRWAAAELPSNRQCLSMDGAGQTVSSGKGGESHRARGEVTAPFNSSCRQEGLEAGALPARGC